MCRFIPLDPDCLLHSRMIKIDRRSEDEERQRTRFFPVRGRAFIREAPFQAGILKGEISRIQKSGTSRGPRRSMEQVPTVRFTAAERILKAQNAPEKSIQSKIKLAGTPNNQAIKNLMSASL